jgi:5-methylcytosine-specific restriction endonuclease McrA
MIPRKIRQQVYDRAKGLCEVCRTRGDFRGLAIHHKVKRSQGGKHELNNVILLCGLHHAKEHGIKEVIDA